jgi:primosomal protein N'
MYFSVIPFSHSIGVQPLLYLWGAIMADQLQVGSLVEIPYGNNLENGIVTGIYPDSPVDPQSETYSRVKTIEKIISSKMILSPYQIEMICAISVRYMIPIHRVLGIFLTRPILSRLEKKNYEQLEEKEWIINSKWSGKLHITRDRIITPDLVDTYIDWPTIVILPDDFAMMPYRIHYSDRDDILFMSNGMTDTRKAQAWIDIANWVFSIIYWTRKILYYNLSKYRNIIYIEDALGPDYWHYPIRIHYSDILRIFATVNPTIDLTILTSVPTLSTLTHFRHFEIRNIE